MILIKILLFIISLGIGFSLMIYSEPLVRTFGKADWAERHFATLGGSYLVWKITGLIVIILGFLFLVGSLDWLFRG